MIKQRKWMALLLAIAMSMSLVTGCDSIDETTPAGSEYVGSAAEEDGASEEATEAAKEAINNEDTIAINDIADVFVPEQVPAYTGAAFTVIHDNIPYFVKSDLSTTSYENYAPLDNLGRCGVAVACVGKDLMPTEKRGSIGQVDGKRLNMTMSMGNTCTIVVILSAISSVAKMPIKVISSQGPVTSIWKACCLLKTWLPTT